MFVKNLFRFIYTFIPCIKNPKTKKKNTLIWRRLSLYYFCQLLRSGMNLWYIPNEKKKYVFEGFKGYQGIGKSLGEVFKEAKT